MNMQQTASNIQSQKPKRDSKLSLILKDWQLYSLIVLPVIFLLVFRYGPMLGNIIAFRRFRPGGSIFGDEWVGTLDVERCIRDPAFWNVFANTAMIGGMTLVRCFPLPIILALMPNEGRRKHSKRIVQSIRFLP